MKMKRQSQSTISTTTSLLLLSVVIIALLFFDVLLLLVADNPINLANAINFNDGYHVIDGQHFDTAAVWVNLLAGGTNAALAGNTTNVVILSHSQHTDDGRIIVDASDVSVNDSMTLPPLHFELLHATALLQYVDIHNFITVMGRLVQGSYIKVDGANYTARDSNYLIVIMFKNDTPLQDVTIKLNNNYVNLVNVSSGYPFAIAKCQMYINHSHVLFDNNSVFYNASSTKMGFTALSISESDLKFGDNSSLVMQRTTVKLYFQSNISGTPSDAIGAFIFVSSPSTIVVETTYPDAESHISMRDNSMSVRVGGTQENPLKSERVSFALLNGASIVLNCSNCGDGNERIGMFFSSNNFSVATSQYNWHSVENVMFYVITPMFHVSGPRSAFVISSNNFVQTCNIGFAISLLLRPVIFTMMMVEDGGAVSVTENIINITVTSTVDSTVQTTSSSVQTFYVAIGGTANLYSNATLQIKGNRFENSYSLSRHIPAVYMVRAYAVLTILGGSTVDISTNIMVVDGVQRVDDLPSDFAYPFGATFNLFGLVNTNTIDMANSSIKYSDNIILSTTKYPNISESVNIWEFAWAISSYMVQLQEDMTLDDHSSILVAGNAIQTDNSGVVAQQYHVTFYISADTVSLNTESSIIVAKNTQTQWTELSKDVVYLISSAVYITLTDLNLDSGSTFIVSDTHLPSPYFKNEAIESDYPPGGAVSLSTLLFFFNEGQLFCNNQSKFSIENSSVVAYSPSGGALATMRETPKSWTFATKGVHFDDQWMDIYNSTFSITNCSFELVSTGIGYVMMFTSIDLRDRALFIISGNVATNTKISQVIADCDDSSNTAVPTTAAENVELVSVGFREFTFIFMGSIMDVSHNTINQSFATSVMQNGYTASTFIWFKLSVDVGDDADPVYPEGQLLLVYNNNFESNAMHLYNSSLNITRILARASFSYFGDQIILTMNSSISIHSNIVKLGMEAADVVSLNETTLLSSPATIATAMNACEPNGEKCQVGVQFCAMASATSPALALSPLSELLLYNNTVTMTTMMRNESRYQPFIQQSPARVSSAFFFTITAIVAGEGDVLIEVRDNNVSMSGLSTSSMWMWIQTLQLNCSNNTTTTTTTTTTTHPTQLHLQSNIVSMVVENPRCVAERGGGVYILAVNGMTMCGADDPTTVSSSYPTLLVDSNNFTIDIKIIETTEEIPFSTTVPLHWQVRGLTFFDIIKDQSPREEGGGLPREEGLQYHYEEGSRTISNPSIQISSNTFNITSSPLLNHIPNVDCGYGVVLACFAPPGMNATNTTQIRAIGLSFVDSPISASIRHNTLHVRLTNISTPTTTTTISTTNTASYTLIHYSIRLQQNSSSSSSNYYNSNNTSSNLLVTHSQMTVEDYTTTTAPSSGITPTTLSLTLDVHVPINTLLNETLVNVTFCGNFYQVKSAGGGGNINGWEGLGVDDRPIMFQRLYSVPSSEGLVPLGEYFGLSRCTQTESISNTQSEMNISISDLLSNTTSLTPPTPSSTTTLSGTAQTPTLITTATMTYSLENTHTKKSLSFTAPPTTSTSHTISISKNTETQKITASTSLNETMTISRETATLTVSRSETDSLSKSVSGPTLSASISRPTASTSGTSSTSLPPTETETYTSSTSGTGATASLCEYTDTSYQLACEVFNGIAVGGDMPSWPDSYISSTCGGASQPLPSASSSTTTTNSNTTPTTSTSAAAGDGNTLHVSVPFETWNGGGPVNVHVRISPKLGGAVVPRGPLVTTGDTTSGSANKFLPATPVLAGDGGEAESSVVAASKGRHGGIVGQGDAATVTLRVQFVGLPSLGQVVDTVWLPTHSIVRCPVNTSGKPVKDDYPDVSGTGPGFPLSASLLVGVRVVFESAGPELPALQPTVTVAATISAVGSIASGMPSGLVRGGLASSLRGMMRCAEFDPTSEVDRMNNPFMMGVRGQGETSEEQVILRYMRGSVVIGVSTFGVAAVIVTTIILIQVKCAKSAGSWGGAFTRMKMPSMFLPITLAVSGISTSNALVLLIYRTPEGDSTTTSTSRSLTQIAIDAALSIMLLVPVMIVLLHYAYASTIGCHVIPAPLLPVEATTKKSKKNKYSNDREMKIIGEGSTDGSSDDWSSTSSSSDDDDGGHTTSVSIQERRRRKQQQQHSKRRSAATATPRSTKLVALLEYLLEPTHEPVLPPTSSSSSNHHLITKNNRNTSSSSSTKKRMSLDDFEVWLQRHYFFVAERRWIPYGAAESLVGVTVDIVGGMPITSRSLISCAAPPATMAFLLLILVVLLVWKWPFAVRLQQWGALSINSLLLVATILVTTKIFVASVTLEEVTSYIIMAISVIIAIFACIDLIVLLLMVVPLLRVYLGLRPVSLSTSLARMRRDARPNIAPPNPNVPRFELAMLFSDHHSNNSNVTAGGDGDDDAKFNKIAMQVLLHRLQRTGGGGGGNPAGSGTSEPSPTRPNATSTEPPQPTTTTPTASNVPPQPIATSMSLSSSMDAML